ncbi:MAG: hypothetical protein GYA21_08835 [Myxococcales bacterium]|nr:hypothetical protein [Myxococcales bacterium]
MRIAMSISLAGLLFLAFLPAKAGEEELFQMEVEVVPSPRSANSAMRMMIEQTIAQALMGSGFVEVRSPVGASRGSADGDEEDEGPPCGVGIQLIYEVVMQPGPNGAVAKGVIAKVVVADTGEILAEGMGEANPTGANSVLEVTERAMKPLVEKLREASRKMATDGRRLSIFVSNPPKDAIISLLPKLKSVCTSARPVLQAKDRISLNAVCRQDSSAVAEAVESVLEAAAGAGKYEMACVSPFTIIIGPVKPSPPAKGKK